MNEQTDKEQSLSARLRAAGRDERLSTGALYLEAADALDALTEPRGTFACSVCGVDTPHWHDVDAVNSERVERRAFETAYTELARAHPDIRVSGWGHGFARRQEKDAPDPVAYPNIIKGWYDRWDTDSFAPLVGEYKNPVIQALWRLWLRSANERTPPSATLALSDPSPK
jgi:hypothetical protein